ncbi:E3 ubiquitin-protein ligase rad18 [Phytophthora boehmeriae]|uniref:RanBP-type and C3HC4-type zinc finger-containing protein 1 n=1 Tax=Phytophthora boehmeriae TaxID=109152 RepID=A0A8T1XEC0_9STRA|nr:E3 ubiquitin-protein ligase rad18 [Phytophthora boehmeriae]
MESHLRCQICGDFFHGPVLLPCSHTFCSACVRRFLQTKGANGCCPECKQPCTSRELVPNRALEQVALLFERAKPELLKRLQGAGGSVSAASTPNTESGKRKAKQERPERMPLMSYSVMRDKEVRKLLDSINVRVPTKNREEIIQIHKEYVLLSNAQADSVNPKSTAQLREEVVRNHYARMQQKAKTDAHKHTSSGGDNSGHGGSTSPASGVSVQMRANFEKLRQDIADRKAGKKPPVVSPSSLKTAPAKSGDRTPVGDTTSIGVWRHFCALDTSIKQEFYVNSVTHEIRVELPSPLALEQSPANRYDDLGDVARAVADAPKAVTPFKPKAKAKRAIAAAFASPDATSEFQRATEEIVVSDNDEEDQESQEQQKQAMLRPNRKRNSLGKHARSKDDPDSTALEPRTCAEDAAAAVETQADTDEIDAPSEWQCSRCTLINDGACQQCEACGYEPVSGSAKKRLRKKMHFQSKISLS